MKSTISDTYEALGGLAMPEDLIKEASDGVTVHPRPAANAHIHLPPNFSAFTSAQDAVDRAAREGVGVLGVSNFYDTWVYGEFGAAARKAGVFPLLGIEIILMDAMLAESGVRVNDPQNAGRIYLCGRGAARLDKPSDAARKVLDGMRRDDAERMTWMCALLNDAFEDAGIATRLNYTSVIDAVMRKYDVPREAVYLQERHAAQAFQETFFEIVPLAERRARLAGVLGTDADNAPDDAVSVQSLIRSRLIKAGGKAYVEEVFPKFEEGYTLLLELGAIPCYPIFAGTGAQTCEFEADPAQLIESLRQRNIHMVELITIRNSACVATNYARALRGAGFVVTAGTEHNTLDMLPLELAFLGGEPIPEDLREIFWEGACVAAAHQFLTRAGAPGFVDAEGVPNAQFSDAATRIGTFRRMGEALLVRFFEETNRPKK